MADKQYRVKTSMSGGWKVVSQVRRHLLVIDQPSASDEGASPLEVFLFSLGGCLSSMAKMIAAEQGFELAGIQIEITASLDPAGLTGKSTDVPIGFKQINAKADIDAPLDPEKKKAFFELVCHRCPIHDNLINPTLVTESI